MIPPAHELRLNRINLCARKEILLGPPLRASLQNNPYVTTYSEGEEPNRYVVIAPKPRESRKEPRNRGNYPQRITQVEEVETVEIYHPQPLDRAPAPESALAPDSPAAEQE